MSIHTGREGGGAGDCASHAPRKPLSLRAHAHPASTHHAVPPPLVSKLPQPPRLLSSGFLFWSAQSPTTTSARKETRETLAVQAADRARHPAPPRLFASRLPVHPATRPIAKLKKKIAIDQHKKSHHVDTCWVGENKILRTELPFFSSGCWFSDSHPCFCRVIPPSA